jgi:hypothetical protein
MDIVRKLNISEKPCKLVSVFSGSIRCNGRNVQTIITNNSNNDTRSFFSFLLQGIVVA